MKTGLKSGLADYRATCRGQRERGGIYIIIVGKSKPIDYYEQYEKVINQITDGRTDRQTGTYR